jgi:hypothetical protein
MKSRKTNWKNRSLLAVAATASLVLGTAGPAAADPSAVTGAGVGTGGDYAEPEPGPCGLNPLAAFVDEYELRIDNVGDYTGVDAGGVQVAEYVGTTRVVVSAGEHWISPLGTHDPSIDPTCLLPLPVPITATVQSNGPILGTSVSCPENEGIFTRVQSAVVIEFQGDCTVSGLLGSVTANTIHVLEGALEPCEIPILPPFGPPLDFVHNVACDLPPFPQDGPGAIWQGTYEAVGVTP